MSILSFVNVRAPPKRINSLEDKIQPTTLEQFYKLGNITNINEIFKHSFSQCLFIHGKPGCGKTLCVRRVLEARNIQYQYIDANNIRTTSFTHDYRVIDNLECEIDISKIMSPKTIFICCSNKIFKYQNTISECKCMRFNSPTAHQLYDFLTLVNIYEDLKRPDEEIVRIAKSVNGDIRFAIKSIEVGIPMFKDIQTDLFDIFKKASRDPFNNEHIITPDSIVLSNILHENIPKFNITMEEMSLSLDSMSLSEQFQGTPYHSFLSLITPFHIIGKSPKCISYGNIWSKISNAKIKKNRINSFLRTHNIYLLVSEIGYIKYILDKKEIQFVFGSKNLKFIKSFK